MSKGTTYEHVRQIRRFLNSITIDEVNKEILRDYLATYNDKSPSTYSNVLKSLKRFFRDFLKLDALVESFEFPEIPIKISHVPSKEQVRQFFNALETPLEKAIFLMFATSGLRRNEVRSLKVGEVDLKKRMITPNKNSRTKRVWISFFNEETKEVLEEYLATRRNLNDDERLFPICYKRFYKVFKKGYEKTGVYITPQTLRVWFSCEIARLKVPDRYVDAFCGRVPKSILARHYSDYSPERLKVIYDEAGLRVLN